MNRLQETIDEAAERGFRAILELYLKRIITLDDLRRAERQIVANCKRENNEKQKALSDSQ